jgi:hypothetical protein
MANKRWSMEDGHESGVRGQRGLAAKFERETRERFPNLSEQQIQRKARQALRAHMQSLAVKSSVARQTRKAGAG